MGFMDWLTDKAKYEVPGTDNFWSVADPGHIIHSPSVPNQPGVTANGPSSPGDLQKDPVTGMYVDPKTGNVFSGPNTSTDQVTNPNVAQQVARNAGVSNALLSQLDPARKAASGAMGGQSNLVGQLDSTINGTGPSVAQSQLAGTLGNIQRTQMAGASGVGGQSAFAARRAALANIGNAQQQASQQAATIRAQEVANAQANKGNVLGQIAGEANTEAGQSISGANAFADNALAGQSAQQNLNYKSAAQQNTDQKDKSNKIVGAIGSFFV